MKMLLVTLLITIKVADVIASCPDDQEPGTCDGGSNHPQLYCKDVDAESKWRCGRKNRIRCVCKAPRFRRRDGLCVYETECDAVPKENEKTDDTTQQSRHDKLEIPEGLRGPSTTFNDTLQLVRNNQTLYALMMIKNGNDLPYLLKKLGNCYCLKSAYSSTTATGAVRSLDCYKEVSETTPIEAEKHGEVEVEVSEDFDRVNILLTLDPSEKRADSPDIWYFRDRYTVYDVTGNCLLVDYGYARNDRVKCILWGFDIESVEQTRCFATMKQVCIQDMEKLWTASGPCSDSNKNV